MTNKDNQPLSLAGVSFEGKENPCGAGVRIPPPAPKTKFYY